MNKKILSVIELVSNEKSLPNEKIFQVVESALEQATKKKYEQDIDVRVSINRKNGNFLTFRRWLVVKEVSQPTREITLAAAKTYDEKIKINDYVEYNIDSIIFDRITTQAAKKVIIQKVREAEKEIMIDQFSKKIGCIVHGIVKKINRNNFLIDLGHNSEAIIFKKAILSNENFSIGDNIRGVLFIIKENFQNINNTKLLMSRIGSDMLFSLIRITVPEVSESIIEIKSIARDSGSRSKIAVKTNDPRVDPVGACVGVRGSRIRSVSNELKGERIDIVLWNENPEQFVINSMAPADVNSITIDTERNSMEIVVDNDNLAQAIGRNGQNVKLASKLTGWELNVITEKELEIKNQKKYKKVFKLFSKYLDLHKSVIDILVKSGFSTFKELSNASINNFIKIKKINEDLVKKIRVQACSVLKLISLDCKFLAEKVNEELLTLDDINVNIVSQLIKKNIFSLKDLAEQGSYDLMNIKGLDFKKAGKLIMQARNASWFKKK